MIAYFEINEKGKVTYGCTTPREGLIELDIKEDVFFQIHKYIYRDGEFIIDENYVEPPRPKTEMEILQEENEELKRRQQATQEALDYILMSVGGGV